MDQCIKEGRDMTSSNLDIVRRWYATFDPDLVHEDIEWNLAEGFPSEGHYRGRKAVFEEWWPKLCTYFDDWKANVEHVLDAGDAIIGLGHYTGRAKATGRALHVPFVHVWWTRAGKIAKLDQHTNTLILHRIINDTSAHEAAHTAE
jgi:ketosteroid isomerase-like protein